MGKSYNYAVNHPRKCEMCHCIFEHKYVPLLQRNRLEWRCPPCRVKPENDVKLPPPNLNIDAHAIGQHIQHVARSDRQYKGAFQFFTGKVQRISRRKYNR